MSGKTIGEFIKNFFYLYGSKIVLTLSGIVFVYLIANALGPSDYGLVLYFIAFVTGLLPLIGLPVFFDIIEFYTPKAKSKKFLNQILKYEMILAILLFVVLFVFAENILTFIGKEGLDLFRTAAVLVILTPLYQSYRAFLSGLKKFGKILKALSFENILNLGIAYLLVIQFQVGMAGVIYANIFSITGFILLTFFYSKEKQKGQKISMEQVKKFGSWLIPTNLFKALNRQLRLVYLGMFVGNFAIGLYYLTEKLFTHAIGGTRESLSNVLIPYISERDTEKQSMANFVSLSIKFSTIYTIGVGIFLVIIGHTLLTVLFPQFTDAASIFPLFILFHLSKLDTFMTTMFKSFKMTDVISKGFGITLGTTAFTGIILVPMLGLNGYIITQTLAASARFAFFLHKANKIDAPVQIIPRLKDIIFFYDNAKKLVIRKIK